MSMGRWVAQYRATGWSMPASTSAVVGSPSGSGASGARSWCSRPSCCSWNEAVIAKMVRSPSACGWVASTRRTEREPPSRGASTWKRIRWAGSPGAREREDIDWMRRPAGVLRPAAATAWPIPWPPHTCARDRRRAPAPRSSTMAGMGHLDLDIPVRWSDLDAYGHVNNAAMVRLLEEARIAAFWPAPAEQVALGAQQPEAALPVGGVGAPVSTVIAS